MEIDCNLIIEYENKEKAEKILRSIKVDDLGFVESRIKDSTLIGTIKSKSISSLINTVDDYLACISIAERIFDKS